jgi:hypothetical protein
MTNAPAAAGQLSRDDLTERIFRALYQEFDLRTINGIYVVVPRARHGLPGPASATSPARSAITTTRARPLPRPGPAERLDSVTSRISAAPKLN